MAAGTRGRLFTFAIAETWRGLGARLHGGPLWRLRYAGPMPDRLVIAPTDLRTADPTIAVDIYAGRFILAGELVEVGGKSVFTVEAPSEEWARRLHGFGWLRHLRASDLALSRSNARALVGDWIRLQARHPAIAWEPEVVARRIISWLSQAPLVLDGCDFTFYRKFLRSLTRQVRHLRRIAGDAPAGLRRLRIMIALASAGLALTGQERFVRQAARWLDAELARQVLPDGGHVSRNPAAILDLLTDLLPLRQAFTARNIQPSKALVAAIDRMMPMLRFFRHGDGSFARFNGMGEAPVDLVATVLAYDDARGKPVQNASHSGYQRMSAGPTLVIADCGPPPPIAVSSEAHAGCLAFELSTGRQVLVVNCGSPGPTHARVRRLARTTAAHSTATLNETSSCRFLTRSRLRHTVGEVILSGPRKVAVQRTQEEGAAVLVARHDGYVDRFNVLHERVLRLSSSGDRLEGIDSFSSSAGTPIRSGKDSYAIRFHLHPAVRVRRPEGMAVIRLTLPDGELWEFETSAGEVAIEESILFSDLRGSRRTDQIVVYGRIQQQAGVSWRFRRTGLAPRSGRPPEG